MASRTVQAETPTERIVREIYEYRDLVEFLEGNYKFVLKEWKRKK